MSPEVRSGPASPPAPHPRRAASPGGSPRQWTSPDPAGRRSEHWRSCSSVLFSFAAWPQAARRQPVRPRPRETPCETPSFPFLCSRRLEFVPVLPRLQKLAVLPLKLLSSRPPSCVPLVLLERIGAGIVAVDHYPARSIRAVRRAVVQQLGVEDHDRAGRTGDLHPVLVRKQPL